MIDWLIKYDWVVKIAGTVAFLLFAGWLASRQRAKVAEGWMYLGYPLPVKVLAACFLPSMLAALVFNGTSLIEEDWWVPPAIALITLCSAWLFYDVFLKRVRWNNERIEIWDVFGRQHEILWKDAKSVALRLDRVIVTEKNDRKLTLNLSYKVGGRELMEWLSRPS